MDSWPGRCWVCDATGRLWCSACRFALYCSLACQKKDRLRHLDECVNSSRRRVCCSYCGREEALGGVPCPDCLVAAYCTDSCRKIDAKNHRSVCLQSKHKVVEAANKINEWNRRAKGIPQYLGRLIHAVDYLRWSENEGLRVQAATISTPRKDEPGGGKGEAGGHSGKGGKVEARVGEDIVRLLLLGADLKHVLCTLHDTPDTCTQPIELTLVDSSPHILARDLLVLYLLMLPDAPDPLHDPAFIHAHAEKVVMVFYSVCLDMETHALLCNTLHNLLNMTHKSFLHEMHQQVQLDPATYTLVQSVWSGWMSFANDPSALHKLEKVRSLKVSGKMIKDVLARYIKSCPREHQKAVTDWIKRGSMKKARGGNFPNVTLACFSPLKREYLDKFEDVSPKWSEETEWIKAVTVDDDMVYAPHGIDMIFQDWDFLAVSRSVNKKEINLVEMYHIYLTQVFSKASYKLLQSSQVSIIFIRSNVRDLAANNQLLKGKYDRIATGIHADLLGTPYVLQHFGSLLRTDNMYSRLLTHHRVWSLCLDWRSDQQARETCLKSLKCNRAPDPLLMITGRWATFRHFLQAELLHHLHVLDGRPLEPENVLVFRNVSHAYDMILSDYTRQLNHLVPFRFQADKRTVSMVDSRLHTLEWRRLGRTRRASAPAATNPAPKSLPTTPSHDIDPASRYVDNLISLSKNPSGSPQPPESQIRSRMNGREGSLSPCPVKHATTRDDRPSRPRNSSRARPRSLYVSTRCKSPLLSPEFDFWEHHNLIQKKETSTNRAYSEIPEGISRRIQQALQADTKQEKVVPKSAPVSPQLTRKTKAVKEKASAFERGTAARSTFPETRKNVETVAPSTPVKKLVSMFSRAFATKDKEVEVGRRFLRSNSLHDSCLTPEQQSEIQSKSYTSSLRFNRNGRNRQQKNEDTSPGQESGMSTFPRRARPHSVAVSKFSYLEGFTDKDKQSTSPVLTTPDKKYDIKKSMAVDTTDNPRNKKGHISPIRSLISGLSTLSVSPVMPRAAARQHHTPLRDCITIKRDELRLVTLRPGSQRLPSPVSPSPSDNMDTIDWPQPSTTSPSTHAHDPLDTTSRWKSPLHTLHDRMEPYARKSPSPSPPWKSALKKSTRKIPHEPEYVAPPLHVTKFPAVRVRSPTPDAPQCKSEATSAGPETPPNTEAPKDTDPNTTSDISDETKSLSESIFSPRSSPNSSELSLSQSQNEKPQESAGTPSGAGKPEEASQSAAEETSPTCQSDSQTPHCLTTQESCRGDVTCWQENLAEAIQDADEREQEIISPEDFMSLTSVSMSSSLTDTDMEVSELFSQQEQFCPIKDSKTDPDDDHKESVRDHDGERDIYSETESAGNAADGQEEGSEHHSLKQDIDSTDVYRTDVTEDIHTQYLDTISNEPQSSSTDVVEERTPSVCKMIEHFAQRIQEQQELLERPPSPKRDVVRRTFLHQTYKEMFPESNDAAKSLGLQSPEDSHSSSTDKSVQKVKDLVAKPTEKSTEPEPDLSLHLEDEDKDEVLENTKTAAETNITPGHVSPKLPLSLTSTPVEELTSTPVTKMVEQFDQHIQAQSLPTSPRTSRPTSIGSLIQQDFLRLYTPKSSKNAKQEDDVNENSSLLSDDCFEETLFEISDDEEQKTGDIGLEDSKPMSQEPGTSDSEEDMEATVQLGNQICVHPRRTSRDSNNSVCEEMRHEFLQKIRSIEDDQAPQDNKKQCDEARSALDDKLKDTEQRGKSFANELSSVQNLSNDPQLEDVTVVTYTVQVDTVQIEDDLDSHTVPSVYDSATALSPTPDDEHRGSGRDLHELDSPECNNLSKSTGSENMTLTSPDSSPRIYTSQRNCKSGSRRSSLGSSSQRKSAKKKVMEPEESLQRSPTLKCSKTGGLDRISFRNYVKTSIANEDLASASESQQTSTCLMEPADTKVVEYTSSFEVSTDEYRADPESVEEAVEAISFLSSDDHSRDTVSPRFTLFSDDSDVGEDHKCKATRQTGETKRHKVCVRRKRLSSVHSTSDLQHEEECDLYCASPTTSPSTCADKDQENCDPLKTCKYDSESSVITGRAEAREVSQLPVKHVDEIKRCRPSEDKEDSKCAPTETLPEANKEVRRFSWGSLRRKKKHDCAKAKKEEAKTADASPAKQDDPAPRTQPERVSKGAAYNFFFDRKKSKAENELSSGSPDNTRGEAIPDKKMPECPSKGSTIPTIISVVPKHNRENEISHTESRFVKDRQTYRSKSSPEIKPKPRKRIPFYKDSSSDNFSQSLLRLIAPSFEESATRDKPPPSSSDGSPNTRGQASDVEDVFGDNLQPMKTSTPSDKDKDPWTRRDIQDISGERVSLQDETEVFTNETTSSNDEIFQVNINGGVEVRPRAGVLKTGRDRSRDSRRSLRVSWGDLPDRMDSPSYLSDADDHNDDNDDDQQAHKYEQDDHVHTQPQDPDTPEDKAYRVTQL